MSPPADTTVHSPPPSTAAHAAMTHSTPPPPPPPPLASSSSSSSRPQPPPPMTGRAPESSSSSSGHHAPHGMDDKDELTTKGRKRKRLAKACSACHKNKRRCDGFAPCSNCEFSSRPCVYVNAQGETIPPPRTRDSSAVDKSAREGGSHRPSLAMDEWPRLSIHDAVQQDPSLAAELLDLFFTRTPPYAAMFHPATFRYRYYLNQVSPVLLDAMFALAARLCEHPAFPASTPPHLRGQPFAERCAAEIDRLLSSDRLETGSWEETEFVQACALVAVYYNCSRQPRRGLYYNDLALSIIGPAAPPPTPRHSAAEFFTLAEVRLRTFWLLILADMCSAANGRARRVSDHDIAHLPLPGAEAHWARWGGRGHGGADPRRRDTIIAGTGNWHSEDGQVGEVGHIIRILSIFANIMSIANNGGAGSHEARHLPVQHYEQALKGWALDLPRNLRFDEVNLADAMTQLRSPVPQTAFHGWAFAYMHAVAECGMFYLQAKTSNQYAAARQNQAVDNLAVILDALGQRGREGPLMFFPILVVTSWSEHVGVSAPLAEHLDIWWAEARREWGWDRHEVLEHGVFPFPARQAAAAAPAPTPSARSPEHEYMLAPLRSRALSSGAFERDRDGPLSGAISLPPISYHVVHDHLPRPPRPLQPLKRADHERPDVAKKVPRLSWAAVRGQEGIEALVSAAEQRRPS